jgi:nitrite reductase (NADH) small subunit
MRHEVLAAESLGPGEVRCVSVDGVRIAVARGRDGRVHALRDACAHQGASLGRGQVEALVEGTAVGQYRLVEGKEILRCPWHGYEYDLDTGRSLFDPEHTRVRVYEAFEEEGKIIVER